MGMTRRIAQEIVADSLDRLPDTIGQAGEEIGALPATLPELITKRVDRLRTSIPRSDRT
jgi:hypothetical protein